MIRVIFDNGEIADCEHIERIYVEEYEMEKIIMVGHLEEEKHEVRADN